MLGTKKHVNLHKKDLQQTPSQPTHQHQHQNQNQNQNHRPPALPRRSRYTTVVMLCGILASVLMLSLVYIQWETIGYALRPVWDSTPRPFQHIPHYYAPNISHSLLCSMHGWSVRTHPANVFDAIIFNNELDLLEIRIRELEPFVTKFVILESNTTFTGIPKPLWLSENAERYMFARGQMWYERMGGRKLRSKEDPFVLERAQRKAMDDVLKRAGIREGDLVIMADVDEIPSGHTIDLLRWCHGIPEVMHLEMDSYLYSFEFWVDKGTWRPSVHIYKPPNTLYGHGRRTDLILADSGWHCSFCFRYIEDIAFKMKAYSHADRVKSPSFLDSPRIQEVLCKGSDLFDMLPEAYTFKELVSKIGPVPKSYSGVNLPAFLLKNHERFKFLLPGNCIREKRENSPPS